MNYKISSCKLDTYAKGIIGINIIEKTNKSNIIYFAGMLDFFNLNKKICPVIIAEGLKGTIKSKKIS